MRLPFFQNKKVGKNVFFGLFLKETEAIAFIMRMHNSKLMLVEEEKFSYSNGWNNLIEDVDQIILKLEQKSRIDIQDTIFFLYSNIIDKKTKEVKKEHFAKIKEMVKKLDLKALGYIECHEAVKYVHEKKEEIPLSAILIELDRADLSVFVYKRGQIVFTKTISHTGNLIDDLLTSFQEIKGTFVLPSRIILYNSKDLESEATDIVTYRWSEDLFIQLPRVEVMKEYEIVQGLIGVFGEQFVKNLKKEEPIHEVANETQAILGFTIGKDIQEEQSENSSPEATLKAQNTNTTPLFSRLGRGIKKIRVMIGDWLKLFKGQSHKWVVMVGIGILFFALLLNELVFHTASLTVYLPSESISKETTVQVPISEEKTADFSVSTSTRSVSLSDSKSTTGKKEVGEKARGTVTIHNFDDSEKTFTKGTPFATSELKFVLDQETKVASSSMVTINGGLVKQPGKTKAALTAQIIGPQANIGAGKQFSIESLPSSTYFAINDAAFAGGTKKEIRTVSKQDLDQIKSSLANKAKSKNLDRLEKGSGELKVLPGLADIKLSDLQYDRELGEEADSLSLSAKAEATLFYYDNKKFIDYLSKLLSDQVKKGFTLQKNKVSYTMQKVEHVKNTLSMKLFIRGEVIVDTTPQQIMSAIKGSNRGSLEAKLKQQFKAEGFSLDVKPNIPLLNNWLPFFTRNISIKISSL